MRPKDLTSPFTWENRRVVLCDKILFVPDYYEAYQDFPPIDWRDPAIFGNEHPIHLEYCSGNGEWIAERALRYPESNWVAVEKKFTRVRKIWAKKKNLGLDNLFIVCGEAFRVSRHYFPSASMAEISINFPDPWPKTRHAKHRLIQAAFIEEIARILLPQAPFRFVTDDAAYSQIFRQEMARHPYFVSSFPLPYYRTDVMDYGDSYFDRLWRGKGKSIRFHEYRYIEEGGE